MAEDIFDAMANEPGRTPTSDCRSNDIYATTKTTRMGREGESVLLLGATGEMIKISKIYTEPKWYKGRVRIVRILYRRIIHNIEYRYVFKFKVKFKILTSNILKIQHQISTTVY